MTSQKRKIVLLPGDGIGPEIVRVAVTVLKDCANEFGHHFEFAEFPFGGFAIDAAAYTTAEIERIAKYAFERAEARTGRLASIDKANVLSTSQLWRRTVTRMAVGHPAVKTEHLYVDNAAMQLVLAPAQFDVIL